MIESIQNRCCHGVVSTNLVGGYSGCGMGVLPPRKFKSPYMKSPSSPIAVYVCIVRERGVLDLPALETIGIWSELSALFQGGQG